VHSWDVEEQRNRKYTAWSLYLCDWCLGSLLAIHINDLFVKFGATPKESGRRNRRSRRGSGSGREDVHSHNIEIAKIAVIASKPVVFKVKL
jgi:hypothetical protein